MIVDSVFPTPIASIINENHGNVKHKILDMLSNEQSKHNQYSSNLLHYFDEGKNDFVNKTTDNFIKWCEECATDFCKNILGKNVDNCIVTDVWVNEAKQNASQIFHNHSNSFVSATYYLNFLENHADLEFENPLLQTFPVNKIEIENKFHNQFNANRFKVPIKEGMLCLWPSYLRHGYESNAVDGRISISMNFMPTVVQSDHYRFKIERLV